MKDDNCIFCLLAAGDIPSATIYEDEDFRAYLDIGPASKGHALIVPKEHYANLFEMPEELAGKAFCLAKKLGEKLVKVLGADGINVLQNNGEAAGQTVFHFHIHLIPRWQDDGAGITWVPGTLDEAVRDQLVAAFAD